MIYFPQSVSRISPLHFSSRTLTFYFSIYSEWFHRQLSSFTDRFIEHFIAKNMEKCFFNGYFFQIYGDMKRDIQKSLCEHVYLELEYQKTWSRKMVVLTSVNSRRQIQLTCSASCSQSGRWVNVLALWCRSFSWFIKRLTDLLNNWPSLLLSAATGSRERKWGHTHTQFFLLLFSATLSVNTLCVCLVQHDLVRDAADIKNISSFPHQ